MDLKLPVATWHPKPFEPAVGRVLCYEPFLENETIAEYVLRQGWDDALDHPARAYVGGVPVEKVWWLYMRPKPDTQVSIHATVSGDDSDMGQMFMLFVMVVAMTVPGMQPFALTGWKAAMMSAAIMVGGALISSALFKPDDPTNDNGEEDKVYNISGNSNSARPYEPLTLLCGRRRVFPDVDEKPFTYFKDNEQYLHQTFNFGLGNITVSDHKIGESTLEALGVSGVEIGDTTVANVDTAEGSDLTAALGWITRTSPDDTTAIEFDVGGIAVKYDKKGQASNEVVAFEAQYSPEGENNWQACVFEPQIIGYTASEYETVLATDEWGTFSGVPPAGDGWELWDSSSEWDSSGG